MKYVTLARHAKSSWDDTSATDFERILNKRGLVDAPEMGRRLVERNCLPELIVSSPAARADATAIAFQTVFNERSGSKEISLQYRDDIYEASASTLLSILTSATDSVDHLMLVGHNPGMETLEAMLHGGTMTRMPSCAVAHFSIDCDKWEDLTSSDTTRVFFDFPKNKVDA